MLSNFKSFVKEHESDITLTIGIVLIALISFGTGRLTAPQTNNEPIVIEGPTASAIKATEPASVKATADKQGRFVGSVNSNKYHWPDCSFGKRIAEQNQIWFSSEAEAQSAGYTNCNSFEQYTPMDYKP